MFKVKAFCGEGKTLIDWRMASVPNVGDELRFGSIDSQVFYKVTRVVVCMDEDHTGQRVNLALEKVP